uniref:Uncharacterized protein n=1 Tax=Knipowitschia caucasica TaxID=637954 RepID=A0AAV2LI61_KNICA
MAVDFRRRHSAAPAPVNIQGKDIERVDSYKYLGIILYGVVCWSNSITERDRKKLDKVIRKSSSVLGCSLDTMQQVGDRRVLDKLTLLLDHDCHPLMTGPLDLASSIYTCGLPCPTRLGVLQCCTRPVHVQRPLVHWSTA